MAPDNASSPQPVMITEPGEELTSRLTEIQRQGLEIIILSTPRPGTENELAYDVFRGSILAYDPTREVLEVEGYSQEYSGDLLVEGYHLLREGTVPAKLGHPLKRVIPLKAKTIVYGIWSADNYNFNQPIYYNGDLNTHRHTGTDTRRLTEEGIKYVCGLLGNKGGAVLDSHDDGHGFSPTLP